MTDYSDIRNQLANSEYIGPEESGPAVKDSDSAAGPVTTETVDQNINQ